MRLSPVLVSSLLLLASLARLPTAEIDAVLEQARAAEADLQPREALEFYLRAAELRSDDPVILQKVAQQYSDATQLLSDRDQKKTYAQNALDYSQRALELAPDNPVNVLSVAISYGKLGLFSGTSDKIKYSRLVKEYADRALELDPEYAWAHHVLGTWNYKVAELGGGTKFLVKLIYGGLPPASFEAAIEHLNRAIELDPDNLIHHLELGFAQWAAGQRDAAREHFEIGLAMPETTVNDAAAKTRARAALDASAS